MSSNSSSIKSSSSNSNRVANGGETLLKKWWELRQQLKQIEKEEQSIREKVKKVMIDKNLTQLRRGDYRVVYREMSRDFLSKKDCPSDIWKKYAKKLSYPWIKVEYIGDDSSEPDEIEE